VSYPTVAIELDGVWVRFHRAGNPSSGASYPLLADIGTLRSTARAAHLDGIGAGEIPGANVSLDNRMRRASDLIGFPLRRLARIEDGDEILFEGVVARVEYGTVVTLEVAA